MTKLAACALIILVALQPLSIISSTSELHDITPTMLTGVNSSPKFETMLQPPPVDPFSTPQSLMYDVHGDQVSMFVRASTVISTTTFSPGVYILKYPEEGRSSTSYISDMEIRANWSLPTNLSSMTDCDFKTDGQNNGLACSGDTGANTRIDFQGGNITLSGPASFIITWNNSGGLMGTWSTQAENGSTCGLGDSFRYPYRNIALHNNSYYILAESEDEPSCDDLTLQDGSILPCSPLTNNGYTTGRCDYLLRISLNGSVIDGLYSRGSADASFSEFSFRTPTTFQMDFGNCASATTCTIRNLTGDVVTTFSWGSGPFATAFTESFEYIRTTYDRPCSNGHVYMRDVIEHQNYTFYTAYTTRNSEYSQCGESPTNSGSSHHSTFLEWMSPDYQNLSRNTSRPYTIGFWNHDDDSRWYISYWDTESHWWGDSHNILSASNDSLFFLNLGTGSYEAWPQETFGKPNYPGATTGNSLALDFNGTWTSRGTNRCFPYAQSLAYSQSSWMSCDTSFATGWQYRAVLAVDSDGDFSSDFVDAFPADATQQVDSDLDGYGDYVLGNEPDDCFLIPGNSTKDRFGCIDADGDGWSNLGDEYPTDQTQHVDSDYDGYGDNISGTFPDACPLVYGLSTRGGEFGCPDGDGDGWADQSDTFPADLSQWNDTDSDGFGDSLIGFQGDACPTVVGTSTRDRFGCADADGDGWSDDGDDFPAEPTQWSDRDLDGYGDNQTAGAALIDAFPGDTTQWNDTDGDGHGDNPYGTQGDWFPNDPSRWQDSDRDGVADEDDAFPNDASQREDSDGDGFGDDINGTNGDVFPDDPDEWADPDGDGYGSNVDAFPNDGSQWNDTDGDGHGDNLYGTEGDWFPNDATRWQDSDRDGVADEDDAFDNDATQWNDTDGDGHGDNPSGTAADRFPDDPSRWQDSDRDGVADEDDAFPNDASQQADRDGDGYGDNPNGNRGDTFPDDATEWADTDADGMGNNADAFPFDPSQTTDVDGDGFGDDPRGSGADRFPNDATQWSDIDGDGYGDNAEGTDPDAFIADPTQWSDADGDGYGDNPTGRQADAFPNEPTQWEDQDGDGFGDNQSGVNPDPYLFDFDNDGYNDSIDPLPKLGSPGDLDNDGTPDSEDAFPEDFREWADSDGDGEGDNADPDDDNDGWADTDELRQGTDPYSGASQPVDSFEIVIPGTQVGLGAWDLIGMFGGIPLFFWIMFGFVTRNGRTARFEEQLRASQSRDELEQVALRWEFMLMLRMLGPHQGIRLERLRAELDDRFEAEGQNLSHLERHEADQTALVVEAMDQDAPIDSTADKAVVELPEVSTDSTAEPTSAAPAASVEAQKTDEQGYEWYTTEDRTNYYRVAESGDDWLPFDE